MPIRLIHYHRTMKDIYFIFVGLIIRDETIKLDNKEFDENAKLPKRGRSAKQCCNKNPE